MNLNEAINLFINRPEIASATRRSYHYDLKKMLNYLGASRPVADIIPADLLRYAQHLDKDPQIASPHTYNKHITSIRAFFKFCILIQLIQTTPALVLKQKRVSTRVPDSKAMPDKKLMKLLDYVAESPRGWNPREEALIRFLADTGVRIGSAASLTEDRINLRDRVAQVEMKQLPTGEYHSVRFGRECSHAISAWLLQREASAGRYIFSTDGHRMTNRALGQYFRRLCQRAKIGSYGPHSLRHRYAYKSLELFPASIGAALLGDTVEVFMANYAPKDETTINNAALQMTTDHIINSQLFIEKIEEAK